MRRAQRTGAQTGGERGRTGAWWWTGSVNARGVTQGRAEPWSDYIRQQQRPRITLAAGCCPPHGAPKIPFCFSLGELPASRVANNPAAAAADALRSRQRTHARRAAALLCSPAASAILLPPGDRPDRTPSPIRPLSPPTIAGTRSAVASLPEIPQPPRSLTGWPKRRVAADGHLRTPWPCALINACANHARRPLAALSAPGMLISRPARDRLCCSRGRQTQRRHAL